MGIREAIRLSHGGHKYPTAFGSLMGCQGDPLGATGSPKGVTSALWGVTGAPGGEGGPLRGPVSAIIFSEEIASEVPICFKT